MQINDIQALEARQKLGELLERVYYQDQRFRISRKNKPMAWLVGDAFINAVGTLLDYIVENEPALADSLSITLDTQIRAIIERGTKERQAGKLLPIESILDDE